jgi:hypothetical protein
VRCFNSPRLSARDFVGANMVSSTRAFVRRSDLSSTLILRAAATCERVIPAESPLCREREPRPIACRMLLIRVQR